MPSYRDWVVELSNTTGTGAYGLAGAPVGTSYFTFRQRYPDGYDKVVFWVVNADRTGWEKNRFSTLDYGSPDTLSREVVESTNGDAPVSWVGGDLPLRIYVVPDSDAQEFAITMGLDTARPEILKFGIWADENDVASGVHTLKLFEGADDIPLASVNEAANKFIPNAAAINFPPGHIQGLTYINSTGDATNDITIAVGTCEDSTGVYPMKLASVLTKQLDAAWAVGTNQGGLDTGAIGNNDYYIHLIARPDTNVVDVLYSLSATAPTMPANYTYRRLFGFIKRVAGAIVLFHTYEMSGGGLLFKWNAPTRDVNLIATLTTARRTDPVKVPLLFSVMSILRVEIADASAEVLAVVYCPDEDDGGPVAGVAPGYNLHTVVGYGNAPEYRILTSSTGTVASRANVGTVDGYNIYTVGFEWARRP